MVKVNDMNIFDVLTTTDKNVFVILRMPNKNIITGCPDDILRGLTYEEIGTNVKAMGFDFKNKSVTFEC